MVQVRQLLQDISLFMAETFPGSIKVVEQIPADLWSVKANPSQIYQVLLNLCINARDAMPQGGNLILRAENCLLDEAAAGAIERGRIGAFLVLHVEDTGTGIAPAVLARMWEPFVTTKGAGKGTGLGLPIVRGIVNNHGGFIQLLTTPGRGSSFRIYLPVAEASGIPPLRVATSAPRGDGELILVVDDEPPIRDMIANMLSRHGYRVLAASDGVEATAFFAKHADGIKLVVSDLNMPNLDGAMLARVLKRMNPDVRVLLVSGLDSPGENRPGFRPEEFTGAFLHKPFKADELQRKVGELLRRPARTAKAG
jgi:CheY-like chemotaxis protein